jgi:hypothetical protein
MSRNRTSFVTTAGHIEPAPRVRGVAELESSVRSQLARISDIETEICRLRAEQIRCAGTYLREQLEIDSRHALAMSEEQSRVMAAEIAVARRISNLSAASWLSDAFLLDDSLPFTLEALERGELSLWSARAIGREVNYLDDLALRRLADEVIAEEAVGMLPGRIKKLAQTRVMGIDPAAMDRRARQERADTFISCQPGDAGVAFLTAKLAAEQALACWHAVHDQATAVYAGGDPEGR